MTENLQYLSRAKVVIKWENGKKIPALNAFLTRMLSTWTTQFKKHLGRALKTFL